MAFKPFLFLTLLLLQLSTAATAQQQDSRIPSEITDLVPSCARECFRSYIVANFGLSGCGSSPSLQCLCTKTGASGYTLGEGAFSCSVAEAGRGNCKGTDADSGVPLIAYNLCSGVPNAAPATHDTIVATLIIPSGTGGLVVPTAAPTLASSTGSTSPSVTGPFSTPKSTSMVTPTLAPAPAESSETPAPAMSSSPPRLSAPQIAGISLGVIAGVVAFGVLLVFVARYVRHRRFGDQDPEGGFAKMRDSLTYGHGSNQGTPPALHGGLQISNPIRKPTVEMDFQRPIDPYKVYYGGNQPTEWQQQTPPEPVHPGMIGIAISPHKPVAIQGSSDATTAIPAISPVPTAAPTAIVVTPPSRGNTMDETRPSPPKPSLTLAIPKGRTPIAGAAGTRDSIVTEFAEDGEGESNPNHSAIWRPPPSDPQSATTYYFADKGGNWILRRTSTTNKRKPNAAAASTRMPISPQIEELPSPDDKTRAERAAQDFPMVAPLRLSKTPQHPQLGSPITFKDQSRINRSSSIYTSNNMSRSIASPSAVPGPVPPSDTYFAMMREGRDLTGGNAGGSAHTKQQHQHQRGVPSKSVNRRVSYQSSTSIESGAAGAPFADYDDEDVIENEPQVSLSPVTQSPVTPLEGRSPVSYPKIPKTGGPRPDHLLPVPATTNTTANTLMDTTPRSPPGQASPTLGPLAPAPNSVNKNKRLLYPGGLGLPTNPNPNRNPGQVKTGSPETRVGVFPTAAPVPPVAELPATPQRRPSPHAYQPQAGLGSSSSERQQYQAYQPYNQKQVHQAPSPAQRQRQQQQRAAPQPQSQPQSQIQAQTQAQAQKRYPSPPQQQASMAPPSTGPAMGQAGQSALLAKRLGAEKAAALSLGGNEPNSKPRKEKWTRESFGPQGTVGRSQQQAGANQEPGRGNGNASRSNDNGGDDLNDLPYPIPITPGWIPQLTPTKRGDDLYLNVQ